MIKPGIFRAAALLGLTAVILGAFAAHALAGKLTPLLLDVWKTAVQYQFYHALTLLALSFAGNSTTGAWLNRACTFFIIGIILFSGSLYAIALASLIHKNLSIIGILTPIGGLFFFAGWIQLIIAPLTKDARN